MPANKNKRKVQAKPKKVQRVASSGGVTSHPKLFISLGLFFVVLGLYLLAFEAQNNAIFGFAMLSLIAGVATAVYANFSLPKRKTH